MSGVYFQDVGSSGELSISSSPNLYVTKCLVPIYLYYVVPICMYS